MAHFTASVMSGGIVCASHVLEGWHPTTHIVQPHTGRLTFCLNSSNICIFTHWRHWLYGWMLHKRTQSFPVINTLLLSVCAEQSQWTLTVNGVSSSPGKEHVSLTSTGLNPCFTLTVGQGLSGRCRLFLSFSLFLMGLVWVTYYLHFSVFPVSVSSTLF